MDLPKILLKTLIIIGLTASSVHAEKITIAAASDLKFAMDEIIAGFSKVHIKDEVQVVYGSSGKFQTQIRQGAPYDLFFSADISYPRELARQGQAASQVKPYAVGRIVIWSANMDGSKMTLASLADPKITRIAIANPKHAPYGKRAEEALRSAGLWEKVQSKLVYGENISQAAQYVQSGNAPVGIIALSLALNPGLAKEGRYYLIPDNTHSPLEQGYIITKQGAGKQLAKKFADFMNSTYVRGVMTKYGFVLPHEKSGNRNADR